MVVGVLVSGDLVKLINNLSRQLGGHHYEFARIYFTRDHSSCFYHYVI